MSSENLKIVIPMAGYGTRLRPHTWSKPKPLVSAAGKTILGHVLDILATAPNADQAELVFIVGYLGEQVAAYMDAHHAHLKAHYVEQKQRRGQSHAIAMARQFVHGPTLIVFVDTLVNTDLSFLAAEQADAVIWVKPVEDPRRFGVVRLGTDGRVVGLIEKPDDLRDNLAIVGFYYFARGEDLMASIDEQMNTDLQTKGEFYLADAMDLMLKRGLNMRTQAVDVWLDAGLPETVLETNRYLLDNGRDNSGRIAARAGVSIKPPVFVAPDVELKNATIGPHASIGPGCRVENSVISNSVLEEGVQVQDAALQASILGARARVAGVTGSLNIGDDSVVEAASEG